MQVTGIVWGMELGRLVGVVNGDLLDNCTGVSCRGDGGVVSEHANENTKRGRYLSDFIRLRPPSPNSWAHQPVPTVPPQRQFHRQLQTVQMPPG